MTCPDCRRKGEEIADLRKRLLVAMNRAALAPTAREQEKPAKCHDCGGPHKTPHDRYCPEKKPADGRREKGG